MSDSGLGTMRFITCMDRGLPRLLYSDIKLTTWENISGNFNKGLTGNLFAAVDINTGALSKAYGSTNKSWPPNRGAHQAPRHGEPY